MGTPVSNSMTELYTMMRYLQYNTLQKQGMGHFDAWSSTFGETQTSIELAPEGTGYRARTRFSKFYNLPELMNMFKEAADIKTADVLDLKTPKANYHTIVVKPTEIQKELVASLSERAAKVHNNMVDSSVDNMLVITNDGRKIGMDQRLINPLLPDDENSKVNTCVKNVHRIWDETKEKRLTQLIFNDISTPQNNGQFNIYGDIKNKLIEMGVPEDEIAFIHDTSSDADKKELFSKVRKGQVRILLGSTPKMGAGTNVQNKLIALHDVDCPWRPSDLEQRRGRIVRQGNQNPEVNIYRYVTEGTFDAYLYQTIENKQKFIGQVMSSKSPVRSCEDLDEATLSYAEIKALCAGNPLIKEKMNLDMEVAKLRLLKANYQSSHYNLEDRLLKDFPRSIEYTKEKIAGMEKDIEQLSKSIVVGKDHISPININSGIYNTRKEAGEALLDACGGIKSFEPIKIGNYRGFEMSLSFNGGQYNLSLKNNLVYKTELGIDVVGNIRRIDNTLDCIGEQLSDTKAMLENLCNQVENAKIELARPFPQEQELIDKSARLKELDMMLNMDTDKEEQGIEADDDLHGCDEFFEAYRDEFPAIKNISDKGRNFINKYCDIKGYTLSIEEIKSQYMVNGKILEKEGFEKNPKLKKEFDLLGDIIKELDKCIQKEVAAEAMLRVREPEIEV